MSRGYKNNNPGNIRLSSIKYKCEVESADPEFKTFATIAWGYRAIFTLLDSYGRKGVDTIDKIINRYAPSFENHTENYIAYVCDKSGVDKNVPIIATNRDIMIPVVAAISQMENGLVPNLNDVRAGWDLFIKHKP